MAYITCGDLRQSFSGTYYLRVPRLRFSLQRAAFLLFGCWACFLLILACCSTLALTRSRSRSRYALACLLVCEMAYYLRVPRLRTRFSLINALNARLLLDCSLLRMFALTRAHSGSYSLLPSLARCLIVIACLTLARSSFAISPVHSLVRSLMFDLMLDCLIMLDCSLVRLFACSLSLTLALTHLLRSLARCLFVLARSRFVISPAHLLVRSLMLDCLIA